MKSKSRTVASKEAVTRTLHRNELRGYRPRKTLQNRRLQARLKYTEENLEKDYAYWKSILWSEETKLELCCHGDALYVWTEKWEAYNLKNTVPHSETRWWESNAVGMLRSIWNLVKVERIMKEDGYATRSPKHNILRYVTSRWYVMLSATKRKETWEPFGLNSHMYIYFTLIALENTIEHH